MDDWLRKVSHQDISVAELKNYKQIKSFTRSYLRELKNPLDKGLHGDSKLNASAASYLPTFEIDNT
jgi:hypothetical protein